MPTDKNPINCRSYHLIRPVSGWQVHKRILTTHTTLYMHIYELPFPGDPPMELQDTFIYQIPSHKCQSGIIPRPVSKYLSGSDSSWHNFHHTLARDPTPDHIYMEE